MSMGGGGGRQMPMASNQGQQMQMGQMTPRVGMMPKMGGNQTTPQNPAALFAPQVYQQPFGQSALGQMQGGQSAVGQMPPYQMSQQVSDQPVMGGGMGSMPSFANQQAYDDFMAQGGMQGMQDRMSGIGGLLGGGVFGQGQGRTPLQTDPNTGYPVGGQTPQQGMTKQQIFEMYGGLDRGPGVTMIDDSGMFRPRIGTQGPGDGLAPRGPYPINDGNVMPPGAGYPPPTNTTMPLPRRRPDDVLVSKPPGDLPGRGMPPGYGPTKGPIDGRKLRDMIDIRTRRPVDGLPNALENNLPPSLKRPTQNRRG